MKNSDAKYSRSLYPTFTLSDKDIYKIQNNPSTLYNVITPYMQDKKVYKLIGRFVPRSTPVSTEKLVLFVFLYDTNYLDHYPGGIYAPESKVLTYFKKGECVITQYYNYNSWNPTYVVFFESAF